MNLIYDLNGTKIYAESNEMFTINQSEERLNVFELTAYFKENYDILSTISQIYDVIRRIVARIKKTGTIFNRINNKEREVACEIVFGAIYSKDIAISLINRDVVVLNIAERRYVDVFTLDVAMDIVKIVYELF